MRDIVRRRCRLKAALADRPTLARFSPVAARLAGIAGAVLASVLLVACAMTESTLVSPKDAVGCRSSAGAYNLSKSYIAFEIHREATGIGAAIGYFLRVPGSNAEAKKGGLAVLVKPDPEYIYCLDYLAAITSNDTFEVQKTNHILKKVTSKADDQSTAIVANLVKTLFVGLSENPNFDETLKGRSFGRATLGGTLVFSGVVDPFDHEDVTRTNDAIRQFGYCIFLEGEPIDPSHDDIEAYCENPNAWTKQQAWAAKAHHARRYNASYAPQRTIDRAGQHQAPRKYSQGLFYRPRLATTYYLYVKENLKLKGVRGAWKLRGTATAFLENAAPILSVGVDRTFFAKRETVLDFDDGVLQDVKITKGSELANFSTIPLQIAQSIAALPTNIIQVKIQSTNNNAALIAAQDDLIKSRRQLLVDQGKLAAATPPQQIVTTTGGGARSLEGGGQQSLAVGGGDARFNQCFDRCLKSQTLGNEPVCQRYCSCSVNQCSAQGDEAACSQLCDRFLQ